MLCESGGNPNAVGDKNLNPHSYGLFQIRGFKSRGTIEQLLQPAYNIDYAYKLYQSSGKRFGVHWVRCSQKNNIN